LAATGRGDARLRCLAIDLLVVRSNRRELVGARHQGNTVDAGDRRFLFLTAGLPVGRDELAVLKKPDRADAAVLIAGSDSALDLGAAGIGAGRYRHCDLRRRADPGRVSGLRWSRAERLLAVIITLLLVLATPIGILMSWSVAGSIGKRGI